MMKRFGMLFILFTAYTVLLGHYVIPHHHHETAAELEAHHATEHQHDESNTSLPNLLGHFIHAEDVFTSTITNQFQHALEKNIPAIVIIVSQSLLVNNLQDYAHLIDLPPEPEPEKASHCITYSLRGPPAV